MKLWTHNKRKFLRWCDDNRDVLVFASIGAAWGFLCGLIGAGLVWIF